MADEDIADVRARSAATADAVALGSGPLDPRAADYLKEQTRLSRLQAESLIEQNAFELSHLRWRRFNDQMKGALQIMVVALCLAVVIGLLVAVWNASQADGIVVEAFSVPPAFAQSGIGGDIVATDLTNKIAAIREIANANSLARSKNVRQDGDNEIKVEIPDTGVSLAQVWRYLRLWFGNERRLSGNVRLLDGGKVALTAVLDGRIFTFTGASRDLDALEQQAAEQIFATFDSSNYVLYLEASGRLADAYAAAQRNVALTTGAAQGGAYALLANTTHFVVGDLALAYARAQQAAALVPKSTAGHMEMLGAALGLGHDEDALRAALIIPKLRREDEWEAFRDQGFTYAQEAARFALHQELGDFAQGATDPCSALCSLATQKFRRAEYAARMHDPAASRALLAEGRAVSSSHSPRESRVAYFTAVAEGDWSGAVQAARAYAVALRADSAPVTRLGDTLVATQAAPLLAVALAHTGDSAGARSAMAATPMDCYDCLRARAVIAGLQGDRDAANAGFSRAIAAAPSIPFAYADQGEMLLRRGDRDAAIAQLDLAHRKGPNFADPLELWGEALIAKNRSDLALTKFEEAARHAPNWGRLHLKWAEALLWSGERDAARRQFAIARSLYLTSPEQAELGRVFHG
jgi:tetratricopeptide (TPR) repeat protein